jgi:hypothetical protein
MRNRILWVALALLAMLALAAGGEAQPPGKKGGPGGKFGKKGGPGAGFRAGLTVDQIVDRIMAFDKNEDGKVTQDELPERMQHLIAMGDTNKDGALDKDEVRKLATTLESIVGLAGPAGPRGGGPGKFAPGFGPGGGPVQLALDELNLSGMAKEKAAEVAKAHQERVRKLQQLIRADLMLRMKEVLSEKDFQSFKTAMEGQGGPPPFLRPRPPDLARSLEQLQKDIEELRRKLPKE